MIATLSPVARAGALLVLTAASALDAAAGARAPRARWTTRIIPGLAPAVRWALRYAARLVPRRVRAPAARSGLRRTTRLIPLAALAVALGSGLVPAGALGLNLRGVALLPLGIALGIAEAGAVIFLSGLAADAVAAIRLVAARYHHAARRDGRASRPTAAPTGSRPRRSAGVDASLEVRPPVRPAAAGSIGQANWLGFTRGRWAAHHRDLLRGSPLALAVTLLVADGLAEEGLLRGGGIAVLRPAGATAAVLLVAAASVAAVLAEPAARRDPCAAVVSAAVLGLVHGALMWAVPTIVPLVAARTALYLFAVP